MNQKPIEIHEFSTGIRPERTANGNWISTGFTGQYMNMTLESVPPAVERSIANREFAVTEGASTDQPAIIGREVGSGNDVWSVVAVVTRGRDEIGRSLSVYRYFLCRGDNNLWKILAWWESQRMPRFNPFDSKEVGQPNLSPESSNVTPKLSPEDEDLADNTPAPILLSPQQYDLNYDLNKVNIFALRKRKSNGQPVSWAFNVEALEQPRRFQVIQPASQDAYEILDREIKNVPQILAPGFMDEEALKSAIRGLINSSKVKPEAVKTIADALEDEQISDKYWHSLFDGQGAQTAIKQEIYSPQMVRLITLRAMVIPETITEFLAWLNVKGTKDKQDENQSISLDFQKSVRADFPKEKIIEGLKIILHHLLNRKNNVESVYWLFKNDTAWKHYETLFIEHIEFDLDIIKKKYYISKGKSPYESLKCDQEIWEEIISKHQSIYSGTDTIKDYKPLAELFEYMQKYDLSAYFYKVSEGQVPKHIYNKISSDKVSSDKVFDLPLTKVSHLDKDNFLPFLNKNYEPFAIFAILLIISLIIYYLLIITIKKPETHAKMSPDNSQESKITGDLNKTDSCKQTDPSIRNSHLTKTPDNKPKNTSDTQCIDLKKFISNFQPIVDKILKQIQENSTEITNHKKGSLPKNSTNNQK